MARTLFRTRGPNGFVAGRFEPGRSGGAAGTPQKIVCDGDTMSVFGAGNFSIRFLGIDTPEKTFIRPGTERSFGRTDLEEFVTLLADPLGGPHGPIQGLTDELADHLRAIAAPTAAANHRHHAERASDALVQMVVDDVETLQIEGFFLAFAYEAIDGFARLLAYVSPDEPETPREERRETYNLRLLRAGVAYPYFIFPNVDPFRGRGSPIQAVVDARDPPNILRRAPALRAARDAVATARNAGRGLFSTDRPSPFEPFELRYISRRQLGSRWLIDLSQFAPVLLPPAAYPRVPNSEDRLWVPAEFIPLFVDHGWCKEDHN